MLGKRLHQWLLASAPTDPALELLHRREFEALILLTKVRLGILLLMLPLTWILGTSALDRKPTTVLLLIYIVGYSITLWQLRRHSPLTLIGLISAFLDILLLSLLPIIWYQALGGTPLALGVLLKSSITLLAILIVTLNAFALRPVYPAIVTLGALLVHGVLLLLAIWDEQTPFSRGYIESYTALDVSADTVATRFIVLALIGLLLTLLAARTRQIVVQAVNLQQVNTQLGRYFSPRLVNQLAHNPSLLRVSGERRKLSFVFTDLAGFTALVERTDPETLVPLLNGYLDALVQVAFRHDGTVDKIVGDAVQVFFGAPAQQTDHAARAVACALEMDAVAERYREQITATAQLGRTRIGVNSGSAVVGNFGGEALFDYTAYGDAVNIAARLESANRYLGTRILISAATVEQLDTFRGRPVGRLRFSGKQQAIMVYEPVAEAIWSDAELAAYQDAFKAMQQNAPDALVRFNALAAIKSDFLIELHQQRLASGVEGCEIILSAK